MATANMGLDKPTLGADPGVWDDKTNGNWDLVDAHDHTTGKGALIPVGGLNIAADLTFAGNAATNLKAVRFTQQADLTSQTSGIGEKTDGNFYFITSAGTEVQVTSGTTLNTSLVGGITGDYTTSDANCKYFSSTKAFSFVQDESPDFWARLKCADVRIYEMASGITNYVAIKSPGSLSATYELTLPGALPATTQGLSVTSGGVVTFDGAHGERTLLLSMAQGSEHNMSAATDGYLQASGGSQYARKTLPLIAGDRITSIIVHYYEASSGDCTANLKYWDAATDAVVVEDSDTMVGTSTSWNEVTNSHNFTVPSTRQAPWFEFVSAGSGDRIAAIEVKYDHP